MSTQFCRAVNAGDVPGVKINTPPYDRIIKLLCSPSIARKSQNFAVGISVIPFGHIHEEHQHPSEEVIYILSGKGEITINSIEIVRLERNSVVILKANEPHSIIVTSPDEDLTCLWVYAPPGPEVKFAAGAGCPMMNPVNHEKTL